MKWKTARIPAIREGTSGTRDQSREAFALRRRLVTRGLISVQESSGNVKSWKKRTSMRILCAGEIPFFASRCRRLLDAGRHVVMRR